MLHKIKEQTGTAGLVVAIVALVAALGGGAYAASHSAQSSKKKVVKVKGPKGPKGATGPQGLQGPAGPAGARGEKGATGDPGSSGKSVTLKEEILPGEEGCNEVGGSVYEIEGSGATEEVCNGAEGGEGLQGAEGPEGPEGTPWTAGGTLPPGATETGDWAFTAPKGVITADVNGTTEEITIAPPQGIFVPISFPIKLPFNLKEAHVHFGAQESGGAFAPGGACPGKFFTPEAAPGELCVYENHVSGAPFVALNKTGVGAPGASRAGTIIRFASNTTEAFEGWGSYAVTGCEEEPGAGECKP